MVEILRIQSLGTVDVLIALDFVNWLTTDTSKPNNVDGWVNLIPAGDDYSFGGFLADIRKQQESQYDVTNILVPDAIHEDVFKMLNVLLNELPNIGNLIKE